MRFTSLNNRQGGGGMRESLGLLVLGLSAVNALHTSSVGAVYGTAVARRDAEQPTATPKAVSFKLNRVKRVLSENSPRRMRKRGIVMQDVDNADYLYYANITIGTPPQPMRLHVDTGSSDVWVQNANSNWCREKEENCNITGTFNPTKSKTYKKLNNDFAINYVDKEYAKGEYGTDTFGIGGESVKGLQFGVANEVNSTEGIMGIGFPENVAQVSKGKGPYANLPVLMVQQGLINSRTYSLWLNDLDADSGELLFGAIDTAKFKGKLAKLPLNSRSGENSPLHFDVNLTDIAYTMKGKKAVSLFSQTEPINVFMDSGTSLIYLPSIMARKIQNAAKAVIDPYYSDQPIIDCRQRESGTSFEFIFNGVTIRVPIDELIIDAVTNSGEIAYFQKTEIPLCYFGVLESEEGNNVLGDTFLRSAYVVYDLDNKFVALAQTHYNVTESNILEIKSGKNGLPDVEGMVDPKTTTPTAEGSEGSDDNPTSSEGASLPTRKSAAAGMKDGRWVLMAGVVAALSTVFLL